MAPKLRCPACGAKGRSDDDGVFENTGVYRNRPLRHCRRCATDFTVPIFGAPKQLTYAESMGLIQQRMDRTMDEFLRMGEVGDGEGGEDDELETEEEGSDAAGFGRDDVIEHFHHSTGALLMHDDFSGGHEWLTLRALKPQPPEGVEAEELLRTYGKFSVAVLAAEGRAKMLRKNFGFPGQENGPVWKQRGEDRWTSYTRYSANIVLIWSNPEGTKQLDSRWERLDGILSDLRGD